MRNEDDRNAFEAEQEILALLSHMQLHEPDEDTTAEDTPEIPEEEGVVPVSPDTTPTEIPLILEPTTQPEEKPVERVKGRKERKERKARKAEPVIAPEAPLLVTEPTAQEETDDSPFAKVGSGLRNLFPKKGDPVSEVVRKCVFFLSAIACLVSLSFLLYYMVLEPNEVNSKNNTYASLFNDTKGNATVETNSETQNIQPSFRQLYAINKDIAGWLAFQSTDKDSFINLQLPVVWCGDNETYLSRGFDGQYSRSGTLFFEQTNTIKQGVTNKVTIVYGHNMASGAMLAPLNKLIGNVYRARSAATFKLDTLYDSSQYKVIAVLVSDESAEPAHRFGYLRTSFADDTDFMNYVNELRARSLFDYPVDVQANDQLVILSTCTNKSQVKVANGRLAVVARRVREGENATTDTAKIVKNDDVIMPYAWYTAQSLTPHAFYTQSDYVMDGEILLGGTTTSENSDATTTQSGETTDTTTDATSQNSTEQTTVATTTDNTTTTSVTETTTEAAQTSTVETTTITEQDTTTTAQQPTTQTE